MLELKLEEREIWDPVKREFLSVKPQTLQLEHSLISLHKWEAKWKKPFLHTELKAEEFIDYIRCMTLNKVNPDIYSLLSINEFKKITDYMDDSMTATTINDRRRKKAKKEIITAEVLYAQMVLLNVPFECRKWHLNQLVTLLQVVSIKAEGPQKMSKSDMYAQQRAINARNRAKYHTKG